MFDDASEELARNGGYGGREVGIMFGTTYVRG